MPARRIALVLVALATCGCAHDPVSDRQKAAFEAARDQCGITVAETAAVQRCMRAKGFLYRPPWQ